MQSLKVRKRYIYLSLWLVVALFCSATPLVEKKEFNNIVALLVMLICVWNAWKTRKKVIEFLLHFQLLYYNYSVIFSRYLHVVNEFDSFYVNADDRTYGLGILFLLIFEICMMMFINNNSENEESDLEDILYCQNSNVILSLALLGLILLIGVFGFDWSSFGKRGAVSSVYEYSGMLFIFGLHFLRGKNHRFVRILYSVLLVLFSIQGLIFGERVATLQFIMIWVIFFIGNKLNALNVILGSITGIILMSVVGAFRSTYSLEGFNIARVITSISNRMFTFDGADLGYYCSLTFIMVANKVTIGTRLDMLWKMIQSIILGESPSSNLSYFTRDYYAHWYGGFFPLAFYFYLGRVGVVLASFGTSRFVNNLFKNIRVHKKMRGILGVYLVTIAARWYMYTPVSLFRPILLFVFGYIMLDVTNKTLQKRR